MTLDPNSRIGLTAHGDESTQIELPDAVTALVTAQRALAKHYAKTGLRFTLDGRLVGDIAEAIAAEAFGLEFPKERILGVDAYAPDKSSVQIKASGINKGPAFTPGEGRAKHLIFLILDFERAEAYVKYNGPEETVRRELPNKFNGTKRVPLARVEQLDAEVMPEQRLKRLP